MAGLSARGRHHGIMPKVEAKLCFRLKLSNMTVCGASEIANGFLLFTTGLRHWISFIETAYGDVGRAFPPKVEDVLIWSNLFRCVGTFCNYLGYLRGACCAIAVDAPPVGHPALRRCMNAIAKRQLYTER